ncbi:hypothetical protein [Pseudarthrobacter sp. 1C304]|uniref:hypothetical protein n=1 Tax=Pseudarthrobacter sp. 1C304 TaxID=3457438 RepID=UPI003FCFEE04
MANKSRRRPARRSSGGHQAGKPAGSPGARALCRDQALGSLIAFMTWHRERGTLPEPIVLVQLSTFLPIYTNASGGQVTAMDPVRIAKFVEALDESDDGLAPLFCASLHEFLHFLRETGRWSGSEVRYRNLHRVLSPRIPLENAEP